MMTIPINSQTPYDVLVGRGLLDSLGERLRALLPKAEKVAILTDDTVAALYLPTVQASLRAADYEPHDFSITPGEVSKSGENYLSLLESLAETEFSRSDVLLCLGGGVVGDLGGFLAATYLRGIPFVQVPTTLLAAVDSSVGGKTAIDLEAGKNLAGAFYSPRLVLCDLDTFGTLPEEVFADGMAEVVKYAMLGAEGLLENLEGRLSLQELVCSCVRRKRDIVERDEFDNGERQLLNFGHTVGHAIEQLSGYEISHGKAVAIGMHVVTRAAVAEKKCPPVCLSILERLLRESGLPETTEYELEALFWAIRRDKKREGAAITLIIPESAGLCVRESMSLPEARRFLAAGLSQEIGA